MGVASLEAQPNNTATATTYTLSAVALGQDHPARYIIAAITATDAVSSNYGISSCSIGGVTATVARQTQDSTGGQNTYIIIALVPTGTTGDIVVTFVGDHIRIYAGVYRVVSLVSATPHATAGDTGDPVSTTINIPRNGLLIGCAGMATAGTAVTTTGLAELYDLSFDGDRTAGGMSQNLAAETGRTVGFDGAGNSGGSFASWQLSMSSPPFSRPPRYMRRSA